jgi:hypothetical protein
MSVQPPPPVPQAPPTPEAPTPPKKPTATVVRPETGVAESMHAPHARGLLGESTMGCHRGSQGYDIIEGPSGTATFIDPATGALNGHQITASGFDGGRSIRKPRISSSTTTRPSRS